MNPFFSILVPVYQVEEYLCQCIDSILAQTFENFELILIDDGSKDGCPAICDAYEKKDARVSVLHKGNGGLVSARISGIRRASGSYIVNVDGDDWIAEDMLQQAYEKIETYQADIVSFSFSLEYGQSSKTDDEPLPEGLYEGEEVRKQIHPRILMDENMRHVHSNLCGKVIRKSLLYPHQAAADTRISLGEDLICIVPVYSGARSVYISRRAAYFYRQRAASMTKTVEFWKSGRELLLVEELGRKNTGIPDYEEQLDRYSMAICFWLLQGIADQGLYRFLEKFEEYIHHPILRERMERAKFAKVSPKTRAAIELIKRNRLKSAYAFLTVCRKLKNRRGRHAKKQ